MSKEIKQVADLTPDPHNPNKGSARGRYMVETSLQEVGAGRSIVVDREGKIISGNKTLEAWAEMGGEIEVIRTDGRKLVVVQRDDLDLDDPTGAARKLSYLDNRASEVSLDWDGGQMLLAVQEGLDLDAMFSDKELERLIGDAINLDLNFGGPTPNPTPAPAPSSTGSASSSEEPAPSPNGGVSQGTLRPGSGERPTSHVVMVQLFFNTETHPPFVQNAKALMEFYDITNLTDLVIRVVEDARVALAGK